MSKKPPKRGDQQALRAKMERKKRRTETAPQLPPRTMILCEGTKTEPNYLREIVASVNRKYSAYAADSHIKLRDNIQLVGAGRSGSTLLDFAVKNCGSGIEEVWLVYDHDDFPAEDFNQTPVMADAQTKREKSVRYRTAWSNECFELWILLHYIPLASNISRTEYIDKIREHYPAYEKNAVDIYTILQNKTQIAIEHAKALAGSYPEGTTPSAMAPCTKMHELVAWLLSYT
jgi:hypothetical protein